MPKSLILAFLLVTLFTTPPALADQTTFDGWQRHSQYISMRDGVKLAVDYYRPTINGQLHTHPLPVVWRFTPYGRFHTGADGQVADQNAIPESGNGSNGKQIFEHLLNQGYIVGQADVRGFNASFGHNKIWLGPQQGQDANDLTEWFSAQKWATDKVGMIGRSYLGSVQFFAATDASPHLKAIVPEMAQIDHYSLFSRNGIMRNDLISAWDKLRATMDFATKVAVPYSIAPVVGDTNRALLTAAAKDHKANANLTDTILRMPFRDSLDPTSGSQHHVESSVLFKLKKLEESGVAIYHQTGWFDDSVTDQLLLFKNLSNPQKLHIGPYFHQDNFGFDYLSETVRWFDYWLKGIDNGIMNEPAVTYFVVGQDPKKDGWQTASQWPEPGTTSASLYLSEGKSGTVNSINDGVLQWTDQVGTNGRDTYLVDRTVSLGDLGTRNVGAFRRDRCPTNAGVADVNSSCYKNSGYPDLSKSYDAKGITYTSQNLLEDITLSGFPEVNIFVSSNHKDADLFVVLEEVDAHGTSHFVSDGAIRTSHRTLNEPAFDNFGLPWHGNYLSDQVFLERDPVLIQLALKPIANLFDKGNRIRLTITGYDAQSGVPLTSVKGKKITIHRGKKYPSSLSIPIR